MCNDFVRFETADCFDVVEEACRGSVVVEGFVGVGRSAVEVYAGFVFGPEYLLEMCCYTTFGWVRQDIPLLVRILLVPVIQVMQLIRRIVLETDGCTRRPFRVFLCDTLLRDALHVDGLASPQLDNATTRLF